MRLLLLICLGLTAATCRAVSAPDAQGGTSTPTGAKPVGVCCDGVPSAAELNPGTVGIRRIAKVTLATPDLVASQKWWETAFGFTAQPKFKSKFGEVVRMTLFNGWLTIELVTAAEGTVLDPAAIIPDPYASNTKWSSVFTQFSFRVVNNTAALDLLRERCARRTRRYALSNRWVEPFVRAGPDDRCARPASRASRHFFDHRWSKGAGLDCPLL